MANRKYVPKSFSEIEKMSDRELQHYYVTVRDVFRKQVMRFAKVNPQKASYYQLEGVPEPGKRYYPTLSERKVNPPRYLIGQSEDVYKRDLVRMAQELTELTPRKGSSGYFETSRGLYIPSIQYQRQKTKERDNAVVEALHNAGYLHISMSTLKNFGAFMDAMREQYGKKLPDSILIAEFFDSLKYNTKKKATADLISLWEEFKNNGYKPTDENYNLFST